MSHFDTWTWCRGDPAGWSCEETPGSAGCHTLNELRHSGPRRAVGADERLPHPSAAADPSSTVAPTPPAGRRRWPGEEPPHNPSIGWRDTRRQSWTPTETAHFIQTVCTVFSDPTTSTSQTFQGLSMYNSLELRDPRQHSLKHGSRLITYNTDVFFVRTNRLYRSSQVSI